MNSRAYIFDLDGTLLDTLPDLVRLTNMVLEECGWPTHTSDEILSYVGDGGRVLLRRAAPEGTPPDKIDAAFARWQALYPTYGHALTRPYDGIPETLETLKHAGMKLGVLSNKFDAAAQSVIAEHFPGVFDIVRGECADIPRKPDPAGLERMMSSLGVGPDQTVYVGDSGTDIATAHAARVVSVGVAWGYRPLAELEAAGATYLALSPAEIIRNA